MKIFVILLISFFITGCSIIQGQSTNYMFLSILGMIFLWGCNKVGISNVSQDTGPVDDPVADNPPVFDKTLLVPYENLSDAIGASLSAINASYDHSGGSNNYAYINANAVNNLVADVGSIAKDFVVIGANYSRSFGVSTITLDTKRGDDTLVFEGYESYSTFDLGPGNDAVVLGSANVNLTLGEGYDRVYISKLQNLTQVALTKGKDKIMLTDGITYADLYFEYVNPNLIGIKIRVSKSDLRWVNVLYVQSGVGGINSLPDLQDPSNFEEGHQVIYARRGQYLSSSSKFPVTPVLTNVPPNLFEISQKFFYNSHLLSHEYLEGSFVSYEYITGTSSGVVQMGLGFTPFYMTPGHDPWCCRFEYEYISGDFVGLETRKYVEISENQPISYDGRFSLGGGSLGNTFVSHAYDDSDVLFQSGFGNIVLNGKRSGQISYTSGVSVNVIVSRQGGNSTFLARPGSYLFWLADGIEFSDLIFVENANDIEIRVEDDLGKQITLLRVSKVNGVTLLELNNSAIFNANSTLGL